MNDKPPRTSSTATSSTLRPSGSHPIASHLGGSSFGSRRMHSVTAKPSAKHLLFRQVLFSVGMDLNIHASSPPSYPISYDESPLSPILKPARVGEQGSKQ